VSLRIRQLSHARNFFAPYGGAVLRSEDKCAEARHQQEPALFTRKGFLLTIGRGRGYLGHHVFLKRFSSNKFTRRDAIADECFRFLIPAYKRLQGKNPPRQWRFLRRSR
jgi:hypothetical protein